MAGMPLAYDLLTETLLVRRIHTSCVCLLNTKATAGGAWRYWAVASLAVARRETHRLSDTRHARMMWPGLWFCIFGTCFLFVCPVMPLARCQRGHR